MQGFVVVGVRGFEPPASSSRTTRANRAALHPENEAAKLINPSQLAKNLFNFGKIVCNMVAKAFQTGFLAKWVLGKSLVFCAISSV